MCLSPQAIGLIGLFLDILGVIALFVYGPPSIDLTKDGHTYLPYNANDEAITSPNRRKYKRHKFMSFLALSLLLSGFLTQAYATWLQLPK